MQHDILLVDDDPSVIQVMAHQLAGVGQRRFATSGEMALRAARANKPDLVLLDAEMPGMSGFQVCQAMKEDPQLCDVPVIFVTSHDDPEFELTGLGMGAVDYIGKPVQQELLVANQLRLKTQIDTLREAVTIDTLSRQANRAAFMGALDREWRRCWRTNEPLSLLRVDIDHFLLYVDRYGRASTNLCLRKLGGALRAVAQRPGDLVSRHGDDAFALLLPHTDRAGAEHLAHRVLDAVEDLQLPHDLSLTARHVTVSVGVASHDDRSACWTPRAFGANSTPPEPQRTAAQLAAAAETALRAACLSGRAQGWFLDVADVEAPAQAREIDPALR